MTNPKTRKTGTTTKSAASLHSSNQLNDGATGLLGHTADTTSDDGDLNELTLVPSSNTEDAEDEDEANSCSSFSLQECINEFRARRIRRLSAQSRDAGQVEDCVVESAMAAAAAEDKSDKKMLADPADADLINQNRCNKEQERKCKPCRNGLCYCFTSDSGEGGVCGALGPSTRAAHVRQPRRARRSECNETYALIPQTHVAKSKDNRRQSAPATFKVPVEHEQQALPQQTQAKSATLTETVTNAHQLTAISRLETSSYDAPLIHIVQELHSNCVISEVRVNKHKIQRYQRSESVKTHHTKTTSPQKSQLQRDVHAPTAPPLEHYTASKQSPVKEKFATAPALDKISELDSLSDAFAYSTPLSSTKNNDSARRKHKAGGRLLQKRLSHSSIHARTRRSTLPPPKPPRSYLCLEEKSTTSSLTSTTPSVREAERIIDEFLRKRGVKVASAKTVAEKKQNVCADKSAQVDAEKLEREMGMKRREMRKSCPTSLTIIPTTQTHKTLPSCPSLSDIQRIQHIPMDKRSKFANYEKNICQFAEKPVKELTFGWKEPKITQMLNCDTNVNQRQFKSQAVQAEPQHAIGWQVPHKIDLDTVDGGVCSNLASNIETKNTPVKTPPISTRNQRSAARESQKFIWSEQWRNLSPWVHKKSGNNGRTFKSNLKSSSRALFHSSKKKILRLVTPKRDNVQRRHEAMGRKNVAQCTVAVQTSPEELRPYEPSSTPQSPPGSYHSAVQTSTQSTTPTCSQNTNNNNVNIGVANDFDFSRTVRPPPKKAPRGQTQRKLSFPLGCSASGCVSCERDTQRTPTQTKTYHSYHSDLDQDVTLSKLGYILGNIRAKLEASDEHAVRTFQEIERREQRAAGVDCPDGPNRRQPIRVDVHNRQGRHRRCTHDDPIYSEIEEDSIHITGTPQYDNSTGLQRNIAVERNVEVLYAKVNKPPKPQPSTAIAAPTALGKILHESLRAMNISSVTPLPTLPEQSSNASDTSYMSPPPLRPRSDTSSLSHCQSLNNVRVREQHSPPKKDRSLLSKSDLSLHRSDIFLDNLCRGEIIVGGGELERIEKVNNIELDRSCTSLQSETRSTYRHFSTSTPTPNDSISYDVPDDAEFECASNVVASQLGFNIDNATEQQHSRGTPIQLSDLNLGLEDSTEADSSPYKRSSSCPTTPHKLPLESIPHNASLTEIHSHEMKAKGTNDKDAAADNCKLYNAQTTSSTSSPSMSKNLAHYQRLKNVLRKSLRRSKDFVKNETKRLSNSFSFPTPHSASSTKSSSHNQTDPQMRTSSSSYDLDALFTLDEQVPVTQQLAQTVTICRQLPELEISPEMVEAERLLLFSKLRRDTRPPKLVISPVREVEQQTHRFYVDGMRLPIRTDVNQDFFFNYFYIVTFECGGVIKSTQSAECQNGQAIFTDCGIEFACGLTRDEIVVNCNIFMLRLRKVSTLSLEPRRPILKRPNLPSTGTSSASSSDEIVSRFRLHASFSLSAHDLVPYEYVEGESKNANKLCLRASGSSELQLMPHTRSTNLTEAIQLAGRAEIRFPKHTHSGYLNVQDPHTLHNWNRRWCSLDGLRLYVLKDENQSLEQPLLSLDLRRSVQKAPLAVAPRELCARPRAFCLQCALEKAGEEVAIAAVFLSADTQTDLEAWLVHVNDVLEFVNTWMT